MGIRDDFGATTLIINGGFECGSLTPSTGASNRAAYYNDLLTYFGPPQESDTGCEDMGSFSNQSSSAYAQNFEAGTEYGKCALVSYQTEFSIFRTDDYKRCVCMAWDSGDSECLNGSTDVIQIIN